MHEVIHNVETDEVTIREFTDDEIKIIEKGRLEAEKKMSKLLSDLEKKENAKKLVLEKLGLTQEEAELLLA